MLGAAVDPPKPMLPPAVVEKPAAERSGRGLAWLALIIGLLRLAAGVVAVAGPRLLLLADRQFPQATWIEPAGKLLNPGWSVTAAEFDRRVNLLEGVLAKAQPGAVSREDIVELLLGRFEGKRGTETRDAVEALKRETADLGRGVQAARQASEAQATTLGTKFEGLEPRFSALGTKIDGLEPRFSALGTKIDGLEPRLSALATRIDGVEPRIETVDGAIKGRLDAIDGVLAAAKASVDEVRGSLRRSVRWLSVRGGPRPRRRPWPSASTRRQPGSKSSSVVPPDPNGSSSPSFSSRSPPSRGGLSPTSFVWSGRSSERTRRWRGLSTHSRSRPSGVLRPLPISGTSSDRRGLSSSSAACVKAGAGSSGSKPA